MQLLEILEQYRKNSATKRDMGTLFEKLVKHYLINDAKYKNRFSNVWLWEEFPEKIGSDSGIDIVATDKDGGYCAIQCKFYGEDKKIDKDDLNSFFTESGKNNFTSRIFVSTTSNWTKKAEETLENQQIPLTRIDLSDLENSSIDWEAYYKEGKTVSNIETKKLREHQQKALSLVKEAFKTEERGKLVMACGTGKTFTSLKIMEEIVPQGGSVLFLVPSLALLSQTHKEWSEQTSLKLKQFAVCSDSKTGKSEDEEYSIVDLEIPATTKHAKIVQKAKANANEVVVVYSTYHSLDTIADAQKAGLRDFDLVICDEAHRTTGVENSHFTKIHDANFIKAKKRLYMTATPKIYSESLKQKASDSDVVIYSMDDESKYGKELYNIGFGEAVEKGLLSDYKVLILAVSEEYISENMQQSLSSDGFELKLDDVAKMVGCWNGLSKNIDGEQSLIPMKRAVSFASTIKSSEQISKHFKGVVEKYKEETQSSLVLDCNFKHVDGKMNAFERKKKLDWLKEDIAENECRILSNARCLSEGVDIPSLDAVMFLQPRKSQVDIIQAVGRVMRKAPNKELGYVILPIAVKSGVSPTEALNNNKAYEVIWQVLQALRSHDERLNSIINSIALNKSKDNEKIDVIGIGFENTKEKSEDGSINTKDITSQIALNLSFDAISQYKEAIYAKIVDKCGDRIYWEQWAKDVADIAQRNIIRIKDIIEQNPQAQNAFISFLNGLQENINKSIGQEEAIEMLAQHIITKPIFNALFTNYNFAEQNIISREMQAIVDVLESCNINNETQSLEKFYESIKIRVSNIDNAEGKQKIIIELYDKFFKTAFPKMAERLGIVYTPVEVVDFIINSVEHVLKQEFNTSLSEKNVNIIDPFTGTGTFITRLLQSGIIKPQDLEYKYKNEIHANEIVLLAYYIASINIETVYHYMAKQDNYEPFEGIVLTDTFNLFESKDLLENSLPENSQRIQKQKNTPVKVIMGNPPYSAGQQSENDNNKNIKYPQLDSKIASNYIAQSSANNSYKTYDSYIRALRWSTDRLQGKNGVIAFVTNGSFIDGNAMDGLRKSLIEEFNKIYCLNLRGNQRTSGETSRKEGGKIFDSGSRAPIAITVFIKNNSNEPCQLYYYDIGDYLKREEKLEIIKNFNNISNTPWNIITPNNKGDWINQRDNQEYESFISLGDKKDKTTKTVFNNYSLGVNTNRDAWVYNFYKKQLVENMQTTINFYNSESLRLKDLLSNTKKEVNIDDFVNSDATKISWSSSLKTYLKNIKSFSFNNENIRKSIYRPFCKQNLYYDKNFNHRPGHWKEIFPTPNHSNVAIGITGKGATNFSCLMTKLTPDLNILKAGGQFFSLYTYKKNEVTNISKQDDFLEEQNNNSEEYTKEENISNEVLKDFQSTYNNNNITKEDIFYYIYGLLNSKEYVEKYYEYITKEIPKIPFTENFIEFSKAGKQLANLNLNYEDIQEYPNAIVEKTFNEEDPVFYKVEKMKFANREDKSTIIYNNHIKITNIPANAYEYIVNGRSAVEWIMDQYQVKIHKDSKLVNNPNLYSEDPQYILKLLLKVINVSVKSNEIINNLPTLIIKK
jgi:predicted helicase